MNNISSLKTAKQMSDHLTDFRKNPPTNSDRAKIGNEVKHLALEDADAPQLAQNIASLCSGTDISHMLDYWDLRDTAHYNQKRHNISSIYFENTKFKDEDFYIPVSCDQLNAMPQDLAILRRHKDRVVAYYLDFLKRFCIPLTESIGNDDYIKVNPERVLHETFQCNVAKIYSNEDCPVRYSSEDRRIAYYFSGYTLVLSKDIDLDGSSSTYFEGRTEFTVS